MARKEPQNIDAEISVLGCGFLEKTALDKIMDEVTDEMFYSDENRIIYKTMKNLHTNNVPVDVATVCNELDKTKDLAKVGGVEYITDIIDSVPSTANLNYYINIILIFLLIVVIFLFWAIFVLSISLVASLWLIVVAVIIDEIIIMKFLCVITLY